MRKTISMSQTINAARVGLGGGDVTIGTKIWKRKSVSGGLIWIGAILPLGVVTDGMSAPINESVNGNENKIRFSLIQACTRNGLLLSHPCGHGLGFVTV